MPSPPPPSPPPHSCWPAPTRRPLIVSHSSSRPGGVCQCPPPSTALRDCPCVLSVIGPEAARPPTSPTRQQLSSTLGPSRHVQPGPSRDRTPPWRRKTSPYPSFRCVSRRRPSKRGWTRPHRDPIPRLHTTIHGNSIPPRRCPPTLLVAALVAPRNTCDTRTTSMHGLCCCRRPAPCGIQSPASLSRRRGCSRSHSHPAFFLFAWMLEVARPLPALPCVPRATSICTGKTSPMMQRTSHTLETQLTGSLGSQCRWGSRAVVFSKCRPQPPQLTHLVLRRRSAS